MKERIYVVTGHDLLSGESHTVVVCATNKRVAISHAYHEVVRRGWTEDVQWWVIDDVIEEV